MFENVTDEEIIREYFNDFNDKEKELFHDMTNHGFNKFDAAAIIDHREYLLYEDCFSVEHLAKQYLFYHAFIGFDEIIKKYFKKGHFDFNKFGNDLLKEEDIYYIGKSTYLEWCIE